MEQFKSEAGESDNTHVLEQFFGMDALTAAEITPARAAMDAGAKEQADSNSTIATVIAAIESEPATGSSGSFEAADQLLAVLNQQQSVATTFN